MALKVTWVLDEIRLLVLKVYSIVEVHKVYEYQVSQHDPQRGAAGFLNNTMIVQERQGSLVNKLIVCNVLRVRTDTLATFILVKALI
jgi:hypothetical protein